MANRFSWRVGGIRIVHFAAVMAIVLWTPGGWAQDRHMYGEFSPASNDEEGKFPARSGPARLAGKEDKTLAGYVYIGSIKAVAEGETPDAEVTKQLEAYILEGAAKYGGDVVRLDKEGVPEKTTIGMGKISWITRYEKTKTVRGLVSEGTVWRYDSDQAEKDAAESAAKNAFAPLDEKLSHGQYAEAELLLAHGADANTRDENGETYLHHAASKAGVGKEVELLLAHGANVNAKDNHGDTPLHEAARHGNKEFAELLLAHGANVHAKDNSGVTPMHVAVFGNKECAALLLAHGADVNARDGSDETPLHWAAGEGNRDLAELLLAHGADINAASGTHKQTPMGLAAQDKRKDMVEFLRQHGGHK